MIYRRFGKTGLQMPVLSAGFMRTMHSWQHLPEDAIPGESQANMEKVVSRALEHGIVHFETARGYGSSEAQLGRALLKVALPDRFILQTKIQPDDDPRRFAADFHDSLQRLGVNRVDLLAIHGINDFRSLWQVCRPGGCLAAARQLQKEGSAGWIGFSGHGPVEVILAAIRHQENDGFDYLNLHWYYVWQVNSPALEEAAKRDMGVFIISPTDKGGMLQKPPVVMRSLCHPFSPMVFNDLYCLGRPEVHTVSVGASQPDDYAGHVAALELIGQAGPFIAGIDERCRSAMRQATGYARPEALWGRLPSWEATPGHINIRVVLWLYNLARGWGLEEYGRKRYGKLGSDVRWVPGNSAADAGRYDFGRIADRAGLKHVELVRLLREAHRLLGARTA